MHWILPLEDVPDGSASLVGGKGDALGRLLRNGLPVPQTLCITTDAYHRFLDHAGLRERIQLEVHRKPFSEFRWEEIWDCAQRIRSLFLKSPMPDGMIEEIGALTRATFNDAPLAVRSSAPEEDHPDHSFAGLHASYTHVQGIDAVIRGLKLVWASLWSDGALLYRQEINLDIGQSAMAVLIQGLIRGDASGIMFTRDPTNDGQAVVEAVHGLNAPLVDGDLSPDRWQIDLSGGEVVGHTPAVRDRWLSPDSKTNHLEPLPEDRQPLAPVDESLLRRLFGYGQRVEQINGGAQDIEWTVVNGEPILLQARPVTTAADPAGGDKRAWYLSLHRSLDNLVALQDQIENTWLPEMATAAADLGAMDLKGMNASNLAAEIKRRWEINNQWVQVYWSDFIPFAHGMRLFGQVYNDIMTPEDPYAFMDLLVDQDLISTTRNQDLGKLADMLRMRPELSRAFSEGRMGELDTDFREQLDAFIDRYGDLSCSVTGAVACAPDDNTLANTLLEMAKRPAPAMKPDRIDIAEAEAAFFDACHLDMGEQCQALLPVARSSYRLRDDDNIYLGAIEAQLISAVQEGRRRIEEGREGADLIDAMLKELALDSASGQAEAEKQTPPESLHARQIVGQPAGPGLGRGIARVIREHRDIAGFKAGEILVCDAIDPNMTFVIPLAAGIVERRGGMLIHGAIIAREYGLPCVTGVPDAITWIQTGDTITVDGFLGIVTIHNGREGDDRPDATEGDAHDGIA